jgi:hypothetical protein
MARLRGPGLTCIRLGVHNVEMAYRRGEKAPPFRELYCDSETQCKHATAAGFDCDIVFRDEHGGYVARLPRE